MIGVGVTGHRVLMEIEKISEGVDLVFSSLHKSYPGRQVLVMSSLAEGADRLVAVRAIKRWRARLVVPLPLPVSEYLADFVTPASKEEFHSLLVRAHEVITLPRAPTRVEAYEAAGRYIVERCTVLIAVWDGSGAQGEGGTGMVVAEARKRGLPFAWIRAGNRLPGTMEPTSLGAEQGMVTFENM